jgi:hypothetical protein
MAQRRRFKQIISLEERLAEEAQRLRERAKSLRPGSVRDELMRKARQAEMAARMSEWLTSPGPRRPEEQPASSKVEIIDQSSVKPVAFG